MSMIDPVDPIAIGKKEDPSIGVGASGNAAILFRSSPSVFAATNDGVANADLNKIGDYLSGNKKI